MNVRTINDSHFKTVDQLPRIDYEHENTSEEEFNECRSMVPKLTERHDSEVASAGVELKPASPAPYWDESLPMLDTPDIAAMSHRKVTKTTSKLPAY